MFKSIFKPRSSISHSVPQSDQTVRPKRPLGAKKTSFDILMDQLDLYDKDASLLSAQSELKFVKDVNENHIKKLITEDEYIALKERFFEIMSKHQHQHGHGKRKTKRKRILKKRSHKKIKRRTRTKTRKH